MKATRAGKTHNDTCSLGSGSGEAFLVPFFLAGGTAVSTFVVGSFAEEGGCVVLEEEIGSDSDWGSESGT